MNPIRRKKLQQNFKHIFWIEALKQVKLLNVVMALFYVHRGLELSHIFILSIIWGVTNLLSELPSSYLADKWGRKKTIILGTIFQLSYWVVYFFADSFLLFGIGTIFLSLGFSMFSGTNEALLYDSKKELGEEDDSLKSLTKFHSAKRIFKIFTPTIAVLLASSLGESQFQLLIGLDIFATAITLFIACTLTEANHKQDVQDSDAHILRDAMTLVKTEKDLLKTIVNRLVPFISTVMVWHYYSVFFVEELHISLLALGIGYSTIHAGIYLVQRFATHNLKRTPGSSIRRMNLVNIFLFSLFIVLYFLQVHVFMIYAVYILIMIVVNWREPLFSELFNKKSRSFNRATTLSLTSFFKGLLDIPIMLFAGLLIGYSYIYPYVFAVILCSLAFFFFRIDKKKDKN